MSQLETEIAELKGYLRHDKDAQSGEKVQVNIVYCDEDHYGDPWSADSFLRSREVDRTIAEGRCAFGLAKSVTL